MSYFRHDLRVDCLGIALSLVLAMLPFPLLANTPLPEPIPSTSRHSISVRLEDLTATHADSMFSALLDRELRRDFVYIYYPITRTNVGYTSSALLKTVPNPFRQAVQDSGLLVRGQLEMVTYGNTTSDRNRFTGYMFFGIAGSFMGEVGENDAITGGLQYRFEVDTTNTVLLVRVARTVDVKKTSRQDLIHQVNDDAVREFLFQLGDCLSKAGLLTFRPSKYSGVAADKKLSEILNVKEKR